MNHFNKSDKLNQVIESLKKNTEWLGWSVEVDDGALSYTNKPNVSAEQSDLEIKKEFVTSAVCVMRFNKGHTSHSIAFNEDLFAIGLDFNSVELEDSDSFQKSKKWTMFFLGDNEKSLGVVTKRPADSVKNQDYIKTIHNYLYKELNEQAHYYSGACELCLGGNKDAAQENLLSELKEI